MTSRRGFLSTLAAAIAAPFLPKPKAVAFDQEGLMACSTTIDRFGARYVPPPFDYKENLERAARQLQKMAAEVAVENAKDLDFLCGDTWDGEHTYNFSNMRSPIRLRGTISPTNAVPSPALDQPLLGCVPQCSEPDSPHSPAA